MNLSPNRIFVKAKGIFNLIIRLCWLVSLKFISIITASQHSLATLLHFICKFALLLSDNFIFSLCLLSSNFHPYAFLFRFKLASYFPEKKSYEDLPTSHQIYQATTVVPSLSVSTSVPAEDNPPLLSKNNPSSGPLHLMSFHLLLIFHLC